MKSVSVTLNDFPVDRLGALAAFLAGSTSTLAVAHGGAPAGSTPQAGTADDDEGGDTVVAAGTVDKTGLPWDDRIHSTPAKLTTKGIWRAKRGVADQLVTSVEAELRARGAQPVAAAAPVQHPGQPAQQYIPPQPVAQAPVPQGYPTQPGYPAQPGNVVYTPPVPEQPVPQQYIPPQPAPAPVQQEQQPPAQPAPVDLQTFMNKLTGIMQMRNAEGAALVDAAYLSNLVARINAAMNLQATNITDYGNNPNALNYAVQIMAAEGRWF